LYQPNHLADVGILRVHRDPGNESIADHSRSPMTSSPGAFLTGVDSPVRRDSSTIPIPSTTPASIGTTSFFSSKIRSPFRSAVDGVVTILLTSASVTIFLLWTSDSRLRRLLAVFFA